MHSFFSRYLSGAYIPNGNISRVQTVMIPSTVSRLLPSPLPLSPAHAHTSTTLTTPSESTASLAHGWRRRHPPGAGVVWAQISTECRCFRTMPQKMWRRLPCEMAAETQPALGADFPSHPSRLDLDGYTHAQSPGARLERINYTIHLKKLLSHVSLFVGGRVLWDNFLRDNLVAQPDVGGPCTGLETPEDMLSNCYCFPMKLLENTDILTHTKPPFFFRAVDTASETRQKQTRQDHVPNKRYSFPPVACPFPKKQEEKGAQM